MHNYKFTLNELYQIWKNHEENGIVKIKLTFFAKEEKIIVHCLCTDDCEPYWGWSGKYDCSLENYAILLSNIVNHGFVDEYTGKPLPIITHHKDVLKFDD